MRSRPRTSTLVGVLALVFWGAALPWAIHRYFAGDARGLLRLGSSFAHPPALVGGPMLDRDGYDGQFFAALATDPLLLEPEMRTYFDAPAYRAGRIGLPLTAWILALGNDRAAVLLYQLLAWSLGVAGVWVVARWLEDEGRSAWWAALLIVSGGVVSTVMGSMPDLAGLSLVVLALWRHRRGGRGAIPTLAGAALIRETNLIAAGAIALDHLRARRYRDAALALAVPAAPVVLWRLWVLARLGPDGLDVPGGNLALPLTWLPEKLAQSFDAAEIAGMIAMALGFAGLPALLLALRRWGPAETTYAAYGALSLCLSRLNYVVNWWGYARTLLPLAMLCLVVAARSDGPRRAWLFRAQAIAWAAVGAIMLYRWAAGLAVALLILAALRRPRAAVASA